MKTHIILLLKLTIFTRIIKLDVKSEDLLSELIIIIHVLNTINIIKIFLSMKS